MTEPVTPTELGADTEWAGDWIEDLEAQIRRLKDALVRLAGCDHAQVDYIAENDYVPDLNDGGTMEP